MKQTDILAVFAHPDDLELCVGGTMLQMKRLGYRTGALDITRGEMSTRGTADLRATEAEHAARLLDLDVRENLDLADGHVVVDDDARTALVGVLRRLKPKVVLTHQIDDPHPDHDGVARLVRNAARISSMRNFCPDSADETIAVPIVAHSVFSRRVEVSFIVDISSVMERKMEAIRAYGSQFYDPESNDPETRLSTKNFLDEIESRSRYFGSLIGVAAGEPYYVREALNIADPIELLTQPMNLYS